VRLGRQAAPRVRALLYCIVPLPFTHHARLGPAALLPPPALLPLQAASAASVRCGRQLPLSATAGTAATSAGCAALQDACRAVAAQHGSHLGIAGLAPRGVAAGRAGKARGRQLAQLRFLARREGWVDAGIHITVPEGVGAWCTLSLVNRATSLRSVDEGNPRRAKGSAAGVRRERRSMAAAHHGSPSTSLGAGTPSPSHCSRPRCTSASGELADATQRPHICASMGWGWTCGRGAAKHAGALRGSALQRVRLASPFHDFPGQLGTLTAPLAPAPHSQHGGLPPARRCRKP
jgi:hypothetical protein